MNPKTMSQQDNNRLDLNGVILYLIKWRKPLLLVTVIATLAAVIFSSSLFLKPKYKSSVVLYSTKTYSVSKSLLGDVYHPDILQFGEEAEAEQLIQIINSDGIRKAIVEKYDLVTHYNLNPKSKTIESDIIRTYDENITVERTPFMSVRIDVLDISPDTAKQIANDISSLIDSAWNRITHERVMQAVSIIQKQLEDKKKLVSDTEDSLKILRKMGIYNYDDQADMIERRYTKAILEYRSEAAKAASYEKNNFDTKKVQDAKAKANGALSAMHNLEARQALIGEWGGKYFELKELVRVSRDDLTDLSRRYEKTKIDLEHSMSHKFVVNPAVKPDRKAYPVRWLIVLGAMISSFLICLVSIIIVEHMKELKQRHQEL